LLDEAAKLREIECPLSAHLRGTGDFAALRHGLHFPVSESSICTISSTANR